MVSQWEIQFYGLSCRAPSGRGTIDPNSKVLLNHVYLRKFYNIQH